MWHGLAFPPYQGAVNSSVWGTAVRDRHTADHFTVILLPANVDIP